VHISFDTETLTESDKLILAAVIGRVGLVSLPTPEDVRPTDAERAALPDPMTEDKPKRVRRTKAQMEADRAAEEAAAKVAAEKAEEAYEDLKAGPNDDEPTPADEDLHEEDTDAVTIEDLKSAASALIVKDREAAKKILGELGVSKVSEIAEEDYAKAVYLFTAAAA
jgi:hypothetical protein